MILIVPSGGLLHNLSVFGRGSAFKLLALLDGGTDGFLRWETGWGEVSAVDFPYFTTSVKLNLARLHSSMFVRVFEVEEHLQSMRYRAQCRLERRGGKCSVFSYCCCLRWLTKTLPTPSTSG